jgi:hypothetical protein
MAAQAWDCVGQGPRPPEHGGLIVSPSSYPGADETLRLLRPEAVDESDSADRADWSERDYSLHPFQRAGAGGRRGREITSTVVESHVESDMTSSAIEGGPSSAFSWLTFIRRGLERSGGIEVLLCDGVRVGRPVDLHRDPVLAFVGTDLHVAHCDVGLRQGLAVAAAGRGCFPVCEGLHVESGLELRGGGPDGPGPFS